MKAKVCFQDEIHRISKLPAKLADLQTHVAHIFQSSLPEIWALQYIDSDQDKIMIQDEKDYEEFQKFLLSGNGASITKIYVEPLIRSFEASRILKAEEDYQVISDLKEEADALLDNYNIEKRIVEMYGKKEEEVHQEKIEEAQPVAVAQEKEEKPVVEEETTRGEDSEKADEETEAEVTQVVEEKVAEVVEEKRAECVEMVGDGRILIDLKTLEKLMLGIIEDKIPMIIQKTKEALKQDEEERKIEVPREVDVHREEKEKEKEKKECKKSWRKCKKWRRVEFEEPKEINENPGMTQEEKDRFNMVNEKAEKMQKCFPKADLDLLLAFVNEAPDDMTLEELVENYKIN